MDEQFNLKFMKNSIIDNIIPYDFVNKKYLDKPQKFPIKIR